MAGWRVALLWVTSLLVAQELVLRWVFPLPEVEGFDRLAYAGALASPQQGLPSLAQKTAWWWSAPDGAAFARHLNLYGFRGRQWSRSKTAGRERVFLVGDSFVEGLGAPDGATIPEVFARQAVAAGIDLESVNLGAAGFQLANYARLLADAVPWFQPDHVLLVLYVNDLYEMPETAGLLGESGRLRATRSLRPRLLAVLEARREGRQVPRRWHDRTSPGPAPLAVAPRFEADPQLLSNVERFVEPDLAAAMKAGELNPAVTNLLARSFHTLRRPVDARAFLDAVRAFLAGHGTRLWVAYLPSLNQVSDAYLEAQARMSREIAADSLTSAAFQAQATSLATTCEELGLPFLDLTPSLRRAESAGRRLYWPYDSHMNGDGYRLVGEELFRWWRAEMESP